MNLKTKSQVEGIVYKLAGLLYSKLDNLHRAKCYCEGLLNIAIIHLVYNYHVLPTVTQDPISLIIQL